jgi:hypothetical protein
MTGGPGHLCAALADGSAGGMKITTRHGHRWVTVPKPEKPDEPTGPQALKEEVVRHWSILDLPDVLNNADFDTASPTRSPRSPPGTSCVNSSPTRTSPPTTSPTDSARNDTPAA